MKYDNVLSNEIGKCPNQKKFVLLSGIISYHLNLRRTYEKGCVDIERKSKISNY